MILTNPIDLVFKESIISANNIFIAVPFISFSTVKSLFSKSEMRLKKEKKMVIKLDDSHLITYDLAAIKHLLECDFEIRFDNNIHLKLYLFDGETFLSSSNLTEGGLKNNFELTAKIDQDHVGAKRIFDDLWLRNRDNNVSLDLVESNWEKYLWLRKKYPKEKRKPVIKKSVSIIPINEELINAVLNAEMDYSWILKMLTRINTNRNRFLNNLIETGFRTNLFYAPIGHNMRKSNLFFEFSYGDENKIAGTGLREKHFSDVFTHKRFQEVLNYIYPSYLISGYYWDFENEQEFLNFCIGLFEFDIPSYKEILPIRLANYFYPEIFLPIFKLSHLGDMCRIFGFESSSSNKGVQLFEYNRFLKNTLTSLPEVNLIKSDVLYNIYFTIMVKNEIEKSGKENIEEYIKSRNKAWIRQKMNFGLELIETLKSDN